LSDTDTPSPLTDEQVAAIRAQLREDIEGLRGVVVDSRWADDISRNVELLGDDRDRLARRVEELEADAKRLDWLESQTAFGGKWYHEEDGFNSPTMQFGVWPDSWNEPTLRAALDAAIRDKPSPAEPDR